MAKNASDRVDLDPFERALFSARCVCGSLSILVSAIAMLRTTYDSRTRKYADEQRATGDHYLWFAREAMETAFLDYTSILICRNMDAGRGVLSVPAFCSSMNKPGVVKQIIEWSRREHGPGEQFDADGVQRRLYAITPLKNGILASSEFARVKGFRDRRAAHATFDEYGMSVLDLIQTYYQLATIGNHFQAIFRSGVYEDDYWDLEPIYLKAAASLWRLDPALDPALVKAAIIFQPGKKSH